MEYFVSYYDYYQPEAYIPSTDTYIEKDSAINDEIDRLRHSATAALSERRDVIIVASVSCIYSLGDPIDYRSMVISLRPGMQMERDDLCKKLVTLQYERNDINFIRNKFRVHGDTVDIYLAYMSDLAIRVEFFGDEIDRITEFNPVTGTRQNVVKHVAIFPASHYIVSADKKAAAIEKIRAECDEQVKKFVGELRQRCYDAMNDDFQTQLVISYLFEACHVINTALDHKANISVDDLKELSDTMRLFTFDLLGLKSEKGANNDAREEAYGKVVDMVLNLRAKAKADKDWATSDQIRDALAEAGFEVKDTKDGVTWKLNK